MYSENNLELLTHKLLLSVSNTENKDNIIVWHQYK